MNLSPKNQKIIQSVIALTAVLHFLYFLLKPQEKVDATLWEQKSCHFEKTRDMVDWDCRYYQTKNWVFAQPHLHYGESLNCFPLSTLKGQELVTQSDLDTHCGAPKYWGTPQSFVDIGWDAYSVWWGRAATLYHRSNATDWPGIPNAILDPVFVKSFSNQEQWHYPWAVPLIYFGIMKGLKSPNPFALQVLHVALWFLCAFLFWKIWPKAPFYVWVAFAFVPSSGAFLLRLYAEIWMLASLLTFLYFLKQRKLFPAFLVGLVIPWIKNEAFLHLLCILFAFAFELKKNQELSSKKWMTFYFSLCFSALFAYFFQGLYKSPSFYVPISERLSTLLGYKIFFTDILRYYADVFFRPALWGFLWPLVLFKLYQARQKIFPEALALLFLVAIIPVAFLAFPGGHKEVVLTGSGRALWQTLPLAWYLLSKISPHKLPGFHKPH